MTTHSAQGVTTVEVHSNGKNLPDSFRIIRVEIEKRVNRISSCTVEMLDGSAAAQDFPLSGAKEVAPGESIEIRAGYGSKVDTVFTGVITRVGIRADAESDSRLVVECKDLSVQMSVGRKNVNYIKRKDSEILGSLIRGYTGLSAKVDATKTVHKEQVQYYCSDWDFMVMRAEANGMLVIAEDGEVRVVKPALKGKGITAQYGVDIISIELEVNASSQLAAVKTRAWDPKKQQLSEQSAQPQVINDSGDLKANKLSSVAGLKEYQLQSAVPMENEELKSWAQAQQVKADFSRLRGAITVRGTAAAAPGESLTLEGVGKRFSGKSFITGAVHTIEEGTWETELELGMEDNWFTEQSTVSYPAATAAVSSVTGLQIGKVLKLDEDPAGEHRIQVALPVNDAQQPGIWARLSNFSASNTSGSFFVPEIGDEVVLGFLDGHPAHPVVLGALYSSKHTPWQLLSADNFTKGIVTRSQLKILFDDEKKIITVETPQKNTLTFSDEEKSIVVTDQTGNEVTLSESGITLNSPKDIEITANGKLKLSAQGNVSIDSMADLSISSNNVNNDGKVGFKAKGGASAALEASGQTTVKGAMVMIN